MHESCMHGECENLGVRLQSNVEIEASCMSAHTHYRYTLYRSSIVAACMVSLKAWSEEGRGSPTMTGMLGSGVHSAEQEVVARTCSMQM